MKHFRLALGIALVLAAFGACVSAVSRELRMHTQAAEFFARTLAEEHISLSVRVGNQDYEITDGVVHPEANSEVRYRVLKTAYALALARRDPLLAIPGVEPAALKTETERLRVSIEKLTAEQASARDAFLLKYSLYPTDFLRALAQLEEKRQQFVMSGREEDENAYEAALSVTLSQGRESAARFATAFALETATTTDLRFPSVGGTITRKTLVQGITEVEANFLSLQKEERARLLCLNGRTSLCVPQDLALVIPVSPALTYTAQSPLNFEFNTQAPKTYYVLSHSACVGDLPGPYLFASGEGGLTPWWYEGNFFFNPTNITKSSFLKYFRDQDVEYLLVNPLEFYQCPNVQTDTGTLNALFATVSFAKAHPELAPDARTEFLSGTAYREDLAIAYLRSASLQIQNESLLTQFETLLLIWKDRTGGLDALVHTIAEVSVSDANLSAQGAPLAVDAPTLFLSHSAFPSLLFGQLLDPDTLRQTTEKDRELLSGKLLRYTDLVRTVPPAKLLHDIKIFLSFEGE